MKYDCFDGEFDEVSTSAVVPCKEYVHLSMGYPISSLTILEECRTAKLLSTYLFLPLMSAMELQSRPVLCWRSRFVFFLSFSCRF